MLTAKEEIELIKLLEIEQKERSSIKFIVNNNPVYFNWMPQPRQNVFLNACGVRPNGEAEKHNPVARVIGFGGAAGGGKSDALLGLAGILVHKYPGINIGYFRRKFVELEGLGGPIDRSRELFTELGKYNGTDHCWVFPNGSKLKFCHLQNESDVYNYQSQQIDVIMFDEGTQFTRFQYRYMVSRNRATINNFIPFMAIATNPGNIGHTWFKAEFYDIGAEIAQDVEVEEGKFEKHIFVPSKLTDNKILMNRDPDYEKKLDSLPENERKMLKDGDFDVFAGQYFDEFRRDIHVVEPFVIPNEWRRYITIDYGLDMLAAYWIALSPQKQAYIYKELYQSNLIISEAAKAIRDMINEPIYQYLAPPDLWNRRQDTGKSAAQLFHENGVTLIQSKNDRVQGWYCLKEWLKPYESKDEQTGEIIQTANMKIFNNCHNLIRTLPQLQHDEKDPNDVANEPHELTHGPDAIRGFAITYSYPAKVIEKSKWQEGSMEYRAQKHIEELIKRKQAGRCELL
ncbi:MAG: hypothetical protein GX660_05840 [Clostridiaceae bacterium]|nr:hypothetical protein [Clostridiaceae bacterium]